MTPLALRIINDMTRPVNKRTFRDIDNLLPHFRSEFHCFEVTKIWGPLVKPLLEEMLNAEFPSVAWSFLPAERTWFEYQDNEGGRIGYMLVRKDANAWADVYAATTCGFLARRIGQLALMDELARLDPSIGWQKLEDAIFRDVMGVPVEAQLPVITSMTTVPPDQITLNLLWRIYPLLLLINTPRVVGREMHDPHQGTARHILANRKTLGIFPLQAWTEITLTTDTIDASGEQPGSTRLSGAMPLHWTRAHKRRVRGVWTLITDYWSGDGSLGIKQSRYTVVP